MKVDPASIARSRRRLERCFVLWHSSPFPMSVLDQKLLVLVIKRYEARSGTSAAAARRGRRPERSEGRAGGGRGGVAEGETGSRRPVVKSPGLVREVRAVGRSEGSASRSSSGRSYDGRQSAAAAETALGEDAVYGFSRSSAQNALCPGYFSLDRSPWLDKLEAMLPAAGRAEVHYLNATGYWLGLSAMAGEMATDDVGRSKDEVAGLLAFSQVLAGIGARVLATRFAYFDLLVEGAGEAAEIFTANVEAADTLARSRAFETEENQEGFTSEVSNDQAL